MEQKVYPPVHPAGPKKLNLGFFPSPWSSIQLLINDYRCEERFKQIEHDIETALERFYPCIPFPPLPTTIPVPNFAGSYWHPAYRRMTIFWDEKQEKLFADRRDSTNACWLTFTHVSGNYFLVDISPGATDDVFPRQSRVGAEFRVGADGKPAEIGVSWEPDMNKAPIWMSRE